MNALSNGGFWWNFSSRGRRSPSGRSKPSDSVDRGGGGGGGGGGIPFKQKATAASLALAGDTLAQLRERWKAHQSGTADLNTKNQKDAFLTLCSIHDWPRAFGMASYGFLLYGPGSYVWYQFLDRRLPEQTFVNLSLKVLLNQIILGPCVIAVAFGWNSIWQQKLSKLPTKYQKDAFPTLLYGFRFWIPVSVLNFSVVPLETRVAFMSTCAIFWNFYLSSTMSK